MNFIIGLFVISLAILGTFLSFVIFKILNYKVNINHFFIQANGQETNGANGNGQGTNEVRIRGNVKNSRFFHSMNVLILIHLFDASLIKFI